MTRRPNTIRVVIADDSVIVRGRLRTFFSDQSDFEIVGEAGNVQEAVALVARETPDILLMDIALPTPGGGAAADAIKTTGAATKIILLTSAIDDDLRLQETIGANVLGCVLKNASRDDLLRVIREARRDAPAFHPAVQKRVLQRRSKGRLPHHDLTPRELDILKEIAAGKSNKSIADDLGLTEGTVKGYVSTVLSKLGVADRTQAAIYAVRNGLFRQEKTD